MDIRSCGSFCLIHNARICSRSEIVDFGNHKGKTLVEFRKSIVRFIPRGIGINFPNISWLDIRNCRLTEIFKEDLIGLEKLKRLELSKNGLKSLPDDLFTNLENLEVINLSCNILENLSSKLFEPIC